MATMAHQALRSDPAAAAMPAGRTSMVPADSIAGRALVAVVAIMAFLAALTLGAVVLVRAAAGEWQSAVARELTIQVRPVEGRDTNAQVKKAADLAIATPGIIGVRAYSKAESARLLEPWLGSGLSIEDLPVPRLVVLRVARDRAPDLSPLRKALAADVPEANLDDHRGWVERMRTMTRAAVGAGVGVLALVVAATMLSVTFATRGAMAANRPVIEVLHFVGARDGFIAGQFQRHFLWLGLKGGAVGGGAAMLLFAIAGLLGDWFKGTAGEALAIVVAAPVLLGAGFLWFVWRMPSDEIALDRGADGIVVLTGGASRILDGVELLAAGRGKRLLISGVHRGTTTGEIARTVPEYARLLACCVDLDHSAVNTLGNAVETRRWVKSRGFRSLIVVTSSYHMPRTMVELAWQMPDVELIPFPVISEKMRNESWWSAASMRLLLFEYMKYLVAQLRTR